MVIAFAGRRIDAANAAEARFPPGHAIEVRERIRVELTRTNANALVCAAACGADILALEAAGELQMGRRVVLPFNRIRFRETSVADRPGDWGERYDRLLDEIQREGELVILGLDTGSPDAYMVTNRAILAEAAALSQSLAAGIGAVIAWDGKSRGASDVTAQFLTAARDAGLAVTEISTL